MSESKRNVPKLRFPGFTEAWEQRKLGEIGTTFAGLSGKTKEDFGHGDAWYITYMNVFSNPISAANGIENIEIDGRQNKVQYGDVLFTTSSETAEEVAMSSLWLSNRENVYLNSFCFGWRPALEVQPLYLAYMLRSFAMRKKLTLLAQGISRYNISKIKVMEIAVPLPRLDEQARIGSFFRDLDALITLHQRKLDHLKLQKRGLLQKMFPRDGSDRPEIRFPGFTDAWEQRKLGEIANRYDNLRIPITASERVFGSTPYYGANGIQDYVEGFTHQGEFVLIAEDGASDLDNYPTMCINGTIWVNNHAHVIQAKTDIADNQYISWSLKRCDIKPLLTGGTRAKLNAEVLMNIEMVTPSRVEQAQIGSFFRDLDTLITLHQRKLDHLKLQKKALLQQMFI